MGEEVTCIQFGLRQFKALMIHQFLYSCQGKWRRLFGIGQCGYSLGVTGQIEERGFYLDYKGFLLSTEI